MSDMIGRIPPSTEPLDEIYEIHEILEIDPRTQAPSAENGQWIVRMKEGLQIRVVMHQRFLDRHLGVKNRRRIRTTVTDDSTLFRMLLTYRPGQGGAVVERAEVVMGGAMERTMEVLKLFLVG